MPKSNAQLLLFSFLKEPKQNLNSSGYFSSKWQAWRKKVKVALLSRRSRIVHSWWRTLKNHRHLAITPLYSRGWYSAARLLASRRSGLPIPQANWKWFSGVCPQNDAIRGNLFLHFSFTLMGLILSAELVSAAVKAAAIIMLFFPVQADPGICAF